MVEAALLLPLVVILLFGLIEFGLIFRDEHSVAAAAGEGARRAASLPRDAQYRDLTIKAIEDRLAALNPSDGDEVVLFKTAVDNADPSSPSYGTPYDYPIGTAEGTSPTDCVRECVLWRYSGTTDTWEEQDPSGSPGRNWPANALDSAWVPSGINKQQCATPGEQDYFGVYVRVTYDPIVPVPGLSLGQRDIESTTISRLEPFVPNDPTTNPECGPGGSEYPPVP